MMAAYYAVLDRLFVRLLRIQRAGLLRFLLLGGGLFSALLAMLSTFVTKKLFFSKLHVFL